MNPYYQRLLAPEKDGISISSLLGAEQQQKEDETTRQPEEPIVVTISSDDEPEPTSKEPEAKRTTRRSNRIAIDSIVSKPEQASTSRTRKPRAALKQEDGQTLREQQAAELAQRLQQQHQRLMEEQRQLQQQPQQHQLQQQPQHMLFQGPQQHQPPPPPQRSPAGMSIMNLMNDDTGNQTPPVFPPIAQQHFPPMHPHQQPPPHLLHQLYQQQQNPLPPQEHRITSPRPLQLPQQSSQQIPEQKPQQELVGSPMLQAEAVDGNGAGFHVLKPTVMPYQQNGESQQGSNSNTPPERVPIQIVNNVGKPKQPRKRKSDSVNANGNTAAAKKGKKKSATPAPGAQSVPSPTFFQGQTPLNFAPPSVSATPEVPFTEMMNKQLKQPDPTVSLPPPVILDVTTPEPSTTTNAGPPTTSHTDKDAKSDKNEDPIIALHVPLRTPTYGPGSAQVVFNVLKMCEDKYGWKSVHPNASKLSMDMYNDDDLDDDDEDMEDDDDDDKEPKEQKEPVKIDGRKLQKGKPKIGQYDVHDPFIDDSEMLWEEQRASTKDGFFVFWGPLVEEGTSARIERADGTVKRNRKKPATGANRPGPKKKAAAPRQQTPETTGVPSANAQQRKAPLPIAPLPYLPK